MKAIQKGFTLIELMIVVAIIGILAAVSLPEYQDYTARAQASEAVELAAGTKTPLAEWYSDKGAWPSSLASLGANTSGKYTSAVAITASNNTAPGSVTLQATFQATGVNSNLASKTLTVTSNDGGANWTCASGGTNAVAAKYLPQACR